MKKIKIPTRKMSSFEEWSAMRVFLQTRDTFESSDAFKFIRDRTGKDMTRQRMATMISILRDRKKAIKAVDSEKTKPSRFQTYEIIHKNLHVTPPKDKDVKQRKLPMKEKKETTVLTLADVERIGEMDLAFIGYTIRTEADILSRKYELAISELKKAQEDSSRFYKELEELKKNHIAEIQTLVKHHNQEKELLKKRLESSKDQERTIQNLNNKITNLNMINENLKKDVQRLEKFVSKVKSGEKTFKLGEVAKFTNNKPPHLS